MIITRHRTRYILKKKQKNVWCTHTHRPACIQLSTSDPTIIEGLLQIGARQTLFLASVGLLTMGEKVAYIALKAPCVPNSISTIHLLIIRGIGLAQIWLVFPGMGWGGGGHLVGLVSPLEGASHFSFLSPSSRAPRPNLPRGRQVFLITDCPGIHQSPL